MVLYSLSCIVMGSMALHKLTGWEWPLYVFVVSLAALTTVVDALA